MKVFTCTDHDYRYPVGVCSFVVEADEAAARILLQKTLDAVGLGAAEFTLQEMDLSTPGAVILLDGDY